MNAAGLARFEKTSRAAAGRCAHSRAARFGPFLYALTEKLSPKEKQALIKATEMPKADVDQWQKLEARAKKLETALRAAADPQTFARLPHRGGGARRTRSCSCSTTRRSKPVQERLRNHFQKYLPAVQEITPEEWAPIEGKPGTPPLHQGPDMHSLTNRLDRRPRKPEVVEPTGESVAPAPEAPVARKARQA